jgi:large subunit ribosomal protein L24
VEGDSAVKLKVRSNEQGQRQLVYSNGDKEVVYRSVKKPK